MRPDGRLLLNTPDIELWPGGLLRARANHDARLLARARRVVRRKRVGRVLAAAVPEGLGALGPALAREPGLADARDALARHGSRPRRGPSPKLPLSGLGQRLAAHGLVGGAYVA